MEAGEPNQKAAARIRDAKSKAEAHIARRRLALGLVDPSKQLREISVVPTALSVIFRYQQVHDDIPVHSAQLTISITELAVDENSALVVPLSVDTSPKLTREGAEKIALRKVGLKGASHDVEASLVVVPANSLGPGVPKGDRLAWKARITAVNDTDGLVSRQIFVDAHSREIIADIADTNDLTYVLTMPHFRGMYLANPASEYAVATYNKSLCCLEYVYIQSPCHGTGLPVDATGNLNCGTYGAGPTGSWLVTSLGNWVGDASFKVTTNPKVMRLTAGYPDLVINDGVGDGVLGSPQAATVAADAFYFMWKTFTYLYYTHGHFGLNRNNGPAVRAVVHHPSTPSQWWGKDHAIIVASENSVHYDMASFDVIAHEIGHGLDDYGPRLQRGSGLESGKLAESTANMFAMLTTGELPYFDPVPYRIGEQTLKNNEALANALTYMDDPALKQGTVACYTPAIGALEDHRGAGPGDHMFYLLVYGGVSKCDGSSVAGVGYNVAERIWYDAFFKLNPTDGYSQLRARFIASASAFYPGPSSIGASTTAAFDAVDIP